MKLKLISNLSMSILVASFLLACGGGSSINELPTTLNEDNLTSNSEDNPISNNEVNLTDSDEIILIKGYLLDSPIEGVGYSCGDILGITTATGEFTCTVAPVTFSIGKLILGTINTFTSDKKVYPQDIFDLNRSNFSDPKVIRLTRLVQSLDDDGNIDAKITIPTGTSNKFNEDSNSLDLETQVLLGDGTLVSEENAIKHLQSNMLEYLPVPTTITLLSTDVNDGEYLNVVHGYNGFGGNSRGRNISPQLSWTAIPTAKSYALEMVDATFPSTHWAIVNIPSSIISLPQSVSNSFNGMKTLGSSYGSSSEGYIGPFPGPQDHRYVFTLYAVDKDTVNSIAEAKRNSTLSGVLKTRFKW